MRFIISDLSTMTVGEQWRNSKLNSDNCHIIDGIYYYNYYNKYAIILKSEETLRTIILPESVIIPDKTILPVEEINYIAFAETDIERVVIPKTIRRIQRDAFRDCKKLKSVQFCGNIDRMEEECFINCSSLERIYLPLHVEKIERACFQGCTSLREFKLPENMTEIPNSMFEGCTSLTSLELPPNITSIGYNSFSYCTGLKEIILGKNISDVGWEAFKNCTNFYSLTITNPNMSIGSEAFGRCSSLRTINLPTANYILEDSGFIGCTSLDKNKLKHTEYGEYLEKRWKDDVKSEKIRKLREKKWYRIWEGIWEGAQTILVLLMLAPIALVGFFLFAIFAQSFVAIATIVGIALLVGLIIFGIYEHFSDDRVNIDWDKVMNNPVLIIAIFVISAIITIVYIIHLF